MCHLFGAGPGRFQACEELLFAHGVRASSMQFSFFHLCLSWDRVLGRFFSGTQPSFIKLRAIAKRRAGEGGGRRNEGRRERQSASGTEAPCLLFSSGGSLRAASSSSSSLPGIDTMEGPLRALQLYPQKNGGFAWLWAGCRVSKKSLGGWGASFLTI